MSCIVHANDYFYNKKRRSGKGEALDYIEKVQIPAVYSAKRNKDLKLAFLEEENKQLREKVFQIQLQNQTVDLTESEVNTVQDALRLPDGNDEIDHLLRTQQGILNDTHSLDLNKKATDSNIPLMQNSIAQHAENRVLREVSTNAAAHETENFLEKNKESADNVMRKSKDGPISNELGSVRTNSLAPREETNKADSNRPFDSMAAVNTDEMTGSHCFILDVSLSKKLNAKAKFN